jgi:signal transduction histidine kinase
MRRLLVRLRRSLFAQVVLTSLASLLGVLVLVFLLRQTAASRPFFPLGLAASAEPVAELVFLIEDVPVEVEPQVLATFGGPTRAATIRTDFPAGAIASRRLEQQLLRGRGEAVPLLDERAIRFRHHGPGSLLRQGPLVTEPRFRALTALEIAIALEDGRVLTALFSPAALVAGRPIRLLGLFIVMVFGVGTLSVLVMARTFRPLRRLERAADRVGIRAEPERIPETGAEEIRRVARAMNRMQERIGELLAERARMVAAIAHDVRTGLTRIRLRLDPPERIDTAALEADLDQMQRLIEDMLAYTRSEQPRAYRELIDLPAFLRIYAEQAPLDLRLDLPSAETRFTIAGDPSALTRALDNLIDNARRYGQQITLGAQPSRDGFTIRIQDDGPGLPLDALERVFEPFYRLEGSRSRRTGGSGLGLGIARTLIRAQGGDLTLANRTDGGLEAQIHFPSRAAIV